MSRTWQLTKRGSQRFALGHPWVFSNELSQSPKGLSPGAQVRLVDAQGKFLAWGYGNPRSLIAFRTLSRTDDLNDLSLWLKERLRAAFSWRRSLNLTKTSFRWCFAEADSLPGLIIDYYRHSEGQTIVAQFSSAGSEVLFLPLLANILREIVDELHVKSELPFNFDKTNFIQQRESSFRILEGLEQLPPELVFGSMPSVHSPIIVKSEGEKTHELSVNLWEGQKTGFFLDQAQNVRLALEFIKHKKFLNQTVRILDLCCYVGQWSSQIATQLQSQGIEANVTLVDVSAPALDWAVKNVSRWTDKVTRIQANVLRDFEQIPKEKYDIVIVDPPAFVKNKKDLPMGLRAYSQLNSRAGTLLNLGGIIVSCSCSGLVTEEAFEDVLAKVSKPIKWLSRGGQSPDHPVQMNFPEGKYLKCWIGIADY